MIGVEYVVRCDDCGTIYDWKQFQSKGDALLNVVRDGWTGNLKHLRCPSCTAELLDTK